MKKTESNMNLQNSIHLLDKKRIEASMVQDERIALEIHECLESTSKYLKENSKISDNQIKICLAETQTHGKGRLNRKWHSPFGANIYLSCFYLFKKSTSELTGLGLAVSVAIVKTLEDCGINKGLTIKWPNDVWWNSKKLAGTLIDVANNSNGSSKAIVGIGLNVNMPQDADKYIDQKLCSMDQILGTPQDRNTITGLLITNLVSSLDTYEQSGLTPFLEKWRKYDHLANKQITIVQDAIKITGKALGINNDGYLILQLSSGKKLLLSSGDAYVEKTPDIKRIEAVCEVE